MGRKAKQQLELRAEIRAAARVLMADYGTAGLSIRALARALDLTPGALYYYYANLDEIITALIVEGYNALADTMADAVEQAGEDRMEALIALSNHYRAWALEHPTDFQLLFGNPIPGYSAPGELTVPAVIRCFKAIIGAMELALSTGALQPSVEASVLPPTVATFISERIAAEQYPVSPLAFSLGAAYLSAMHGLVMLELMRHLQSTVGDTDAFYRQQMHHWLRAFGGEPGP